MKRFVSYLYSVYNNQKIHNAGFARMELRTGRNRVEIHLKENGYSGKTGTVYLFIRNQENIQGISIGNITFRNNQADFRYEQPDDRIGQTPWQIMQMHGILIMMDERAAFLSQWDEQPIDTEKFQIWNGQQDGRNNIENPQQNTEQQENQRENMEQKKSRPQNTEQNERVQESTEQKKSHLENTEKNESQRQNANQEERQRQNTGQNKNRQDRNTKPVQNQHYQHIRSAQGRRYYKLQQSDNQKYWNNEQKMNQEKNLSEVSGNAEMEAAETAESKSAKLDTAVFQPAKAQAAHAEEERKAKQTTAKQVNLETGTAESSTTEAGITESGTRKPGTTKAGITGSGTTEAGITGSETTKTGITGSETTKAGITGSGTTEAGITGSETTEAGTTKSARATESAREITEPGATRNPGITGSGTTESAKATANPADLRTAELQPQQKNQWEQTWRYMLRTYPVLNQFAEQNQVLCVRIEIKDVRLLPAKYWSMVNNSFLLHGFFNYRYLAFGRIGQNWFVGIPGIYQNQEHVMASIFGFPDFLPQKQKTEQGEQSGYWYRILEI